MRVDNPLTQATTRLYQLEKSLEALPQERRDAVDSGDIKRMERLRKKERELVDSISAQKLIIAKLKLNLAENQREELKAELQKAETEQLKIADACKLQKDILYEYERLFNLAAVERAQAENNLLSNASEIKQMQQELEALKQAA